MTSRPKWGLALFTNAANSSHWSTTAMAFMPSRANAVHVAPPRPRARYTPSYPHNVIMMNDATSMATERTVRAHETRPDGRALSEDTGYQANLRYGSQQSLTRDWAMPMHQTDTLFHKAKVATAFIFGGEADNHAINTVPKETLVKITKAEDGGMDGKGLWLPATTGQTPSKEYSFMDRYLKGDLIETT